MTDASDPPTTSRARGIGRPSVNQGPVGKEALIDATCDLLQTTPHTEVTRVAVARQAGVDPSLIKYYFGDRGSLLAAAAEKLMVEAMERAAPDIDDSLSAEDRLRKRVTALFNLHIANPFFHRLVVDEVVNSDRPASRKVMKMMTERGMASYQSILDQGLAAGTFRKVDIAFFYMSIVAMCEFFMDGQRVLHVAMGREVGRPQLAKDYLSFMIDLVINGIKA